MKKVYQNVIAIDGPSGSGKSTVARELAHNLNVLYIDTGAMFRALAFYADQKKCDFSEGPHLDHFLNSIKMSYGVNRQTLIDINGENLTEKIREHHVSHLASIISQLKSVRQYLLNFQRQLAFGRVCVMEGRDIGTVVFPEAFCKFFITASIEVRAERRLEQLRNNGDLAILMEQVIADVKSRDESDMNRAFAPLKQAEDAILLDTSKLPIEQIIELLAKEVRFRAAHIGLNLELGR